MPVGRGPRLGVRSVFVLGGTLLAIALVLVFMVVYLSDSSKVRLGKNQFDDLNAARTAQRIRNDGPIQFPDVSGGSRVVILSHEGDDPLVQWFVFDARAAGAAKDCIVDWDRTRQLFVDRCDPTKTYPLEGTGLRQYAVRVDNTRLVIDFNVDPLTTTTVVTTTTSKK